MDGMSSPQGAFGDFLRTAAGTVRSGEEAGARRLRDATAGLRGAITAMFTEVVRERDPQGYVEAAVDLRGRLQEMNISAYAMRDLDADGLSQVCFAAYQVAAMTAAQTMAERFAEMTGVRPGDATFDEAVPDEMRSWAEVEEIRKAAR
jgi:DNA-binding protein YbaB